MDIKRESYARKRRMRRILYAVSTILVVVAISMGLSRLEPAVPALDRSTIWVNTVKRGPMSSCRLRRPEPILTAKNPVFILCIEQLGIEA